MNAKLNPPRTPNQATLRRLRSTIDATFPAGRFVAIGDDRILGDAASFAELEKLLRTLGRDPGQSLIVEVGAELADGVTIFL